MWAPQVWWNTTVREREREREREKEAETAEDFKKLKRKDRNEKTAATH